MNLRRKSSAANWPFWLLIAAWLCANIPATASLYAFTWLKEAKHFSHYAELRDNVANLLTGQARPICHRVAAAQTAERTLPASLPAGSNLKKIDLSLTPVPIQVVASGMPAGWSESDSSEVSAPVEDVPYPPPRVSGLV